MVLIRKIYTKLKIKISMSNVSHHLLKTLNFVSLERTFSLFLCKTDNVRMTEEEDVVDLRYFSQEIR
jgi:hypothetical protein